MTSTSLHDTTLAATQIAQRSLRSWLNVWQTTASVGMHYWGNAAARGSTPLDLAGDGLRWLELLTKRRTPEWSTPNRVVETSGIMTLRAFAPVDAANEPAEGTAATLILPPQAGHHSCIVDYSADQSQVRTAIDAGLRETFVLEWLGATPETRDATIGDYVAAVKSAIDRIGGPVNLIGDCQGGWLATIYAALYPADVATLSIGGAPIDFHAGDAAIADFARCAGALGRYRLAVALGGGVLSGNFMLGSFIGLQPETEVAKQLELALHLDDEAYVERYRAFQDWYATTQPIPGAMYLWAVEHLFIGNELVRGTLEVEGRPVRLAEITCPINLLGGTADHITPPSQVLALADHVGTPAADVTTRLTPGGHLGLFMGREALAKAWAPMFADIAARNRRNPLLATT